MFRPILILGAGIQNCREEAIKFAERSGYPVCLTWGAADLMRYDHPLRVGTFGTHGNRYANFAIQNADYILCVGSRLDTKATGSPASSFAPKARIVMVDIDQTEMDKFKVLGRNVEGINDGALSYFLKQDISGYYPQWLATINAWKQRYPAVLPEWREENRINPYVYVDQLSDHLREDDVIVSDTGCSLGWMMQAFRFQGQRYIHAFNQTPMGYGLPAAIGAAFATGKRVILVTGDGGLAVNITEMATVARHNLPIKIILFNNRGHAMCRQTQRQWMNGEYPSTSYDGGLACPDYYRIAQSYDIESSIVNHPMQSQIATARMMETDRPRLLELHISQDHGLIPQAKFGHKLEDQEPLLPREELEQVMLEAA